MCRVAVALPLRCWLCTQAGPKRKSRIACPCGVTDRTPEADDYEGLWIQCTCCLAWQHGACVGVRRAPRGGPFAHTQLVTSHLLLAVSQGMRECQQ